MHNSYLYISYFSRYNSDHTTSLFRPSCGRSQIHFQPHQRPSREPCPSVPPMLLIPQAAFFQYVLACTSKSILTVTTQKLEKKKRNTEKYTHHLHLHFRFSFRFRFSVLQLYNWKFPSESFHVTMACH